MNNGKGMKLVVNNEVEDKTVEERKRKLRITREATPDDMQKVDEFAYWLTQFPDHNILGLLCLTFDLLDERLNTFDAVETSQVVANAIAEARSMIADGR